MGAKIKRLDGLYVIIDDNEGEVHETLVNPTERELMDACKEAIHEHGLDADALMICKAVLSVQIADSLIPYEMEE